jgi:dTDP-4-dehydrorhamnose 3,5-epimerase
LVRAEVYEDERGSFARSWCKQKFENKGLVASIVQEGISSTKECGTLRGMHYQDTPHGDVRLVRCARGAIYDVVVDVRPESPTYLQWAGYHLIQGDCTMLYIPERCAHGFQTLEDESEVIFSNSAPYVSEAVRGIRWNDPLFAISWPHPEPTVISERDQQYEDFQPLPSLQTPWHSKLRRERAVSGAKSPNR